MLYISTVVIIINLANIMILRPVNGEAVRVVAKIKSPVLVVMVVAVVLVVIMMIMTMMMMMIQLEKYKTKIGKSQTKTKQKMQQPTNLPAKPTNQQTNKTKQTNKERESSQPSHRAAY